MLAIGSNSTIITTQLPAEQTFSFTLTAPTIEERVERILTKATELSLCSSERLLQIEKEKESGALTHELVTFVGEVIRPAERSADTLVRQKELEELVKDIERLFLWIDPKNTRKVLIDLEAEPQPSSSTVQEQMEVFLNLVSDLSLCSPERSALIQEQKNAEDLFCQLGTFVLDVIRPAQMSCTTPQERKNLEQVFREMETLIIYVDPEIQDPAAFLLTLEELANEADGLVEEQEQAKQFFEERKRQFRQEANAFCREHIQGYFEQNRVELLEFNRDRQEQADLL
ncbi:MAG: hypothetical protein K2X08_02105, partial [Chlamydiales bacterium]|nr:hypothetical protein [Chlamydiales bacterium]